MNWRIAIITASDRCYRSEQKDQSSIMLRQLLADKKLGEVVEFRILPDEVDMISMALIECADILQVDLVLTTGGTGFSPRDVTPEATARVIERYAPGLAEVMRYRSMEITPRAMLSRGIAGIRKSTLIINLPGSPTGAYESLNLIVDQLDHALKLLNGEQDKH